MGLAGMGVVVEASLDGCTSGVGALLSASSRESETIERLRICLSSSAMLGRMSESSCWDAALRVNARAMVETAMRSSRRRLQAVCIQIG